MVLRVDNSTETFNFVASVSKVDRSSFQRLIDPLKREGYFDYAFSNLMFCPLTSGPSTHELIKKLNAEHDISVSLDSGGYESQVNEKYSIRDIYQFDREYYLENEWPSEYVLPDIVPTSKDDADTIEKKVQDTISLARLLFSELPASKQMRAMPVIQGHTKEQVVSCLDAYKNLDHVSKVGFGSFATGGVSNGVNFLTEENISLLQFVVEEAHKHDLEVHAFGIGGPTSIPVLYYAGVDSFDSTGWHRSGGYGNAFFPFKSRLNVTHLRDRSGATLYKENLRQLRQETDHQCPFCTSFDQLHNDRVTRILHNLIVIRETVDLVKELSVDEILQLLSENSPYYSYLEQLTTSPLN